MITDRPMFLTRAEVAELTGAKLRRRQISVLVRNGIRHTINAAVRRLGGAAWRGERHGPNCPVRRCEISQGAAGHSRALG